MADGDHRPPRALLVAGALSLASLLVEPFVIARVTAPYSFLHQAISDLGVTTCGPVAGIAGDVEVCSPAWPLMNAGLVVAGLALVLAALLLPRAVGAGRWSVALLVVAGLSTAGAGLLPLDVSEAGHLALALPAFPAQAAATTEAATIHTPPPPTIASRIDASSITTALTGPTLIAPRPTPPSSTASSRTS